MLPATLTHFKYKGIIDDLGPYLQKEVPIGYRNILVFAREITIKSDINYRTAYYQRPANLRIVCKTLHIEEKKQQEATNVSTDYTIDLSGENATSFSEGCCGGSIAIYLDNNAIAEDEGRLVILADSGDESTHDPCEDDAIINCPLIKHKGGHSQVYPSEKKITRKGKRSLKRNSKDENNFYVHLPVTATYLQKALNIEMVHIFETKYQCTRLSEQEVKDNIAWICKIADKKGLDLLKIRCQECLEMCCTPSKIEISLSEIKVPVKKLNDYFESLIKVATSIADKSHEPSADPTASATSTTSKNDADPSIEKHAQVIRLFAHLYDEFEQNKTRLARCALSETNTTKFSELLSNDLTPPKELNLTNADNEVCVKIPVLLKGLSISVDNGPVEEEELGVLFSGKDAEYEAIKLVASIAVHSTMQGISSYLQTQSEKIATCEAKAQLSPLPIKDKFKEKEKIFGLLEECEPIEGNDKEVVARFDSIPLCFTEKRNQEPRTSELDDIQINDEQLAQLKMHRSAFSILPSSIITATVPKDKVSEDKIGEWFEFKIEIKKEKANEAEETPDIVQIVPVIDFTYGKIVNIFLTATESRVPVIIQPSSIKLLTDNNKQLVVTTLGFPLSTNSTTPKGTPVKSKKTEGTPHALESNEKQAPTKLLTPDTLNAEDEKKMVVSLDSKTANMVKLPKGSKFRIVNVGQGSCSILFDGNNPTIVFDVGYGGGQTISHDDKRNINEAETIIISHWDKDHFRYFLDDKHVAQNKKIIAPLYASESGPSTKKALQNIRNATKQYYLITDSLPQHSNSDMQAQIKKYNITTTEEIQKILPDYVRIKTTTQRSSYSLETRNKIKKNKNNISAIVAHIIDDQGDPLLLIPGDASYDYVERDQKDNLKYLIATHHGSTNKIGKVPCPRKDKNNKVFFSHSIPNQHHHHYQKALDKCYGDWENFEATAEPEPHSITFDLK